MVTANVVNREYEPSDLEDDVIAVLKEGRANPQLLRETVGVSRQRINHALNQLQAAGWVRRVTRGLYELVEDPRVDSE